MGLSMNGWQNATTTEVEAAKSSRRQAMINYWKENNNTWKDICSIKGCEGKFEHGAHIRQGNGPVYLVKMCAYHNEQKKSLGEFELNDNSPLIKASDLP
jgi:hypothetical protein